MSWAVAFPLIQTLNLTVGQWLTPLLALVRGALTGAAMIGIMTYIAMPAVAQALAWWLYPRA